MNCRSKVPLWGVVALLLFAILRAPGPVALGQLPATEPSTLTNEFCPVMPSLKSKPDIWADYHGQRIYFCHQSCKRRFLADPERYQGRLPANMRAALVANTPPVNVIATQPSEPAVSEHSSMEYHAHGTGNDRDRGSTPWARLGRFHVVLVHFPIGLLVLAGLAQVASLLRPSPSVTAFIRISVLLAAFLAPAVAALGWLNATAGSFDPVGALEWHRWLGVSAAGLAVLAAIASAWQQRRPSRTTTAVFAAAIIIAAIITGLAGHFGGVLVYGPGYLMGR